MGWFKRKDTPSTLRRNILNEKIDFGNLITSAFHAKALYDELKKKCHPDRFLDETMRAKADQLFQQITEHKEDYGSLLQLKEQAEKELMLNDD